MNNTNQDQDRKNDQPGDLTPKPDPETLHTTDPQENMEGPISSIMHGAGDAFDTEETKKEANEEKKKNI